MKVVINLKKTDPFKKLFVKTAEKEMFDKIVETLKKKGATEEKIGKFIKENEYKGKVSYQFDLNCSGKTWDAVERFAELDCKIDFGVNEKDYCFAKITIVDGVEQVLSYTPSGGSDENVTGWACGAIPSAPVQQQSAPVQQQSAPVDTTNDLPFN